MELKLMSYNIQHGLNYKTRIAPEGKEIILLPALAHVIRNAGADIVGLNEVYEAGPTPEYFSQAENMAAMMGYQGYFAAAIRLGEGWPYGNALLSRWPIQKAETILIPDPPVKDEDAYYETRCVLRAVIEPEAGKPITVLVSHFGLAKAEMRNAVATAKALFEAEEGPVVLMGDFNMTPDDPILAPLLEIADDSAALFDSEKLSFPADAPEMKIDYILGRNITFTAADIPAVLESDHRPYTATVEY